MKANELRIGNLVNCQGKICKVKALFFLDMSTNYGTYGYSFTEPIPLSEEILLKCGFVKATDKYRGYLSPSFRNGQAIRVKTTNSGNFIYQLNHEGYPLYLESLHQLQNLFHSLSGGQELNTPGLI